MGLECVSVVEWEHSFPIMMNETMKQDWRFRLRENPPIHMLG